MDSPTHQRARGELRLSFKRRADSTVLDTLRQDGCLKARFPREDPSAWHMAVTLNSAGGIAGGDTLRTTVTAGPDTAVTIAAQAAERVYRALPDAEARIATTLHVAPGAALEWLPQETILFDRCALRRTLDVHVAAGARFLGLESLVFGRTAMNEQVHQARLHDCIALHHAGNLVLHDAIRLDGPVAALLARPAIGRGARAVATLLMIDPDAPALLDPLRHAFAGQDAGATMVDGVLVARIVAPTGAALRAALVPGLNILRRHRTLPRVWMC